MDAPRSIQLPHTAGCLVCGRDNPHGLRLDFFVDALGFVRTNFTPAPAHIGFDNIIHGGVLATVLDEAMVWSATWAGRRFCVAAEITVRFKKSARVGVPLVVEAHVESAKRRLIITAGTIREAAGGVIAESMGKFTPVSEDDHAGVVRTFVDEPATREAASMLSQRLG